jgi:hypothetical protein
MMTDIKSLSSLNDFWGNVLVWSTLVVFVGVIGEYVVEFTSCIKDRKLKRGIGKASTLILIAGVAGELLGEATTGEYSTQIAAIINQKTEILKGENIALEKQIAPRDIIVEQQRAIADKLKWFSGRRVAVFSYILDIEGMRLAMQIEAVLHLADIEIESRVGRITPMGGFSTGVNATGSNRALVDELRSSLNAMGGLEVAPESALAERKESWMSASSHNPNEDKPVDAIILVGAKPLQVIK